ncbi:MAG: peptidase [Acidimicrobiales bacterium]|nr:MAG: peptidase [Acidimicrobiales bacterium]
MRVVLCGLLMLLMTGPVINPVANPVVSATANQLVAKSLDAPLHGPFVRPVDGPIVRGFQPGLNRYSAGHRGVDFAASIGATVRAAGNGTVTFTGMVAGRPVVSIEHATGLQTTYEPVLAVVAVGQSVKVGQTIGKLLAGHVGCTTAACLHWGLRRSTSSGETYLDPLLLLGRGKVRLKPLHPGDS